MIKRYDHGVAHGDSQIPESFMCVREKGAYVAYEDYAELQQKLDALAAENAALKSSIPSLKHVDLDNDNIDDVSLAEDIGFNDAVTLMNRWKGETPATDAYLNAVRAEGVDMFSAHQRAMIGKPHKNDAATSYASRCATEFADSLRSGNNDTADKAGAK